MSQDALNKKILTYLTQLGKFVPELAKSPKLGNVREYGIGGRLYVEERRELSLDLILLVPRSLDRGLRQNAICSVRSLGNAVNEL